VVGELFRWLRGPTCHVVPGFDAAAVLIHAEESTGELHGTQVYVVREVIQLTF